MRPNRINHEAYILELDKLIAKLSEKQRRILFADNVVGGDVLAKTSAAKVPSSTYYRRLNRAKTALHQESIRASQAAIVTR